MCLVGVVRALCSGETPFKLGEVSRHGQLASSLFCALHNLYAPERAMPNRLSASRRLRSSFSTASSAFGVEHSRQEAYQRLSLLCSALAAATLLVSSVGVARLPLLYVGELPIALWASGQSFLLFMAAALRVEQQIPMTPH